MTRISSVARVCQLQLGFLVCIKCTKSFQLQGASPTDSPLEALPLAPAGGSAPRAHGTPFRLALHALAMVPPLLGKFWIRHWPAARPPSATNVVLAVILSRFSKIS